MADSIETHVRNELMKLESTVTAVEKLGSISVGLRNEDMPDFAFVAAYLGEQLQNEFQAFHILISQELLPFVVGLKSQRLQ